MPLPIIQRELSLAARRRATIWFRVGAAVVAVVIGGGGITIQNFAGGGAAVGKVVFTMLTWLALAVIVTAGVFLTSDALSEEKRTGTLGLLFLTDLRGYDVVLGKLAATSLRSFEGLLAIFPVLAISLVAGGVPADHFWKVCLALLNVLFCSNAAGLFASAMSREHLRSVGRTILLLLLLLAGGPVLDMLMASLTSATFLPRFSLTSPMFAFVSAGGAGMTPFWQALGISHAAGWLLLGIASLRLPHWWQERPGSYKASSRHLFSFPERDRERGPLVPTGHPAEAPTHAATGSGSSKIRRLLEANPVHWLVMRERRQVWGLWLLALVIAGVFVFAGARIGASGMMFFWTAAYTLIMPILYIRVAVRTCSFFCEARRTGFFELLMVSPVGPAQIVQGFWVAFLQVFGSPIMVLLGLQLAGLILGFTVTGLTSGTWEVLASGLGAVGSFFTSLTSILAIVWFSMWMGLTSKNTGTAALTTILLVIVVPWLAGSFFSALLIPLAMMYPPSNRMFLIVPMISGLLMPVLYIAKNIAFFLWARKRLFGRFRAEVSGGSVALRFVPPPAISPAPFAPPRIA